MSKEFTIRINGRDLSAQEGETVLDVARRSDIYIPSLCHLKGLSPVGACRLCLVEVKGVSRLVPSCTTYVHEGLDVITDSERIQKCRMVILQLLFSERNHTCSVCVSNGHCELQAIAENLGMNYVRYPYRFPALAVVASHEKYAIDHNRCILCTRCVRACQEVEGAHTLEIIGRGVHSLVLADLDGLWGESQTCTSCGKCVQVCPTGALFEKGKAVGQMKKRDEFLPYLMSMRSLNR